MSKYIIMKDLCKSEAFGSRMGNYAALYAISLVTGHTPAIINNENKYAFDLFNKQFRNNKDIHEIFPNFLKIFSKINHNDYEFITHYVKDIIRDDSVYNINTNHNYNFKGLFHLYHYWYDFKEDIKELYEFDKNFTHDVKKLLPKSDKELVSICVRHEYVINKSPSHVNLTLDYYNKAMSYFPNANFLIFSDDISYCKDLFKNHSNIFYTDPMPSATGMYLMSVCDHNINANSSFSWWASFLNKNPNKKIICPKYYIKTVQFEFINSNYYLDDWIYIDNL